MAEGTANTESKEKKRMVYLELKLNKISSSEIVEIEPDISEEERTITIDFSNAEERFLELVKKAFLQGKDWNTFTNLNKLVVKSRHLFRDVSITVADGNQKLEYLKDRTETLGIFNKEIGGILNDCVHGSQESCYKNALKEIHRRYEREFVHKNDSEIKIGGVRNSDMKNISGNESTNDESTELSEESEDLITPGEKNFKEVVAEDVFMEFLLFFLKRAFLYLEKPDSYHIDCPEIYEGESFTESFLRASVEMKRFFCGTVTTGNSSNRGCFLLTGESLSPITVSQDENNNNKCKLDKKIININDIKTISFDSPAMCFRECCAYILSPQKVSYTDVFADFFRIKNRSFNKSYSDGDEPENKIIFDIAFYQWFRNRLRQLGLLGEKEQPSREHIFKYFDCVLFYLKNLSDGLKEKDVDKLREIIDVELGNLETDTEERELKFSDLINNYSVKAIIIFLETLLTNFGIKTRNSDLINKIKNCMNVECKGDAELSQLKKLPECVLGKNQALLIQNGTLNIDNCRKLLSFLMMELKDWRARHSSLSAEDNSAGDNRESYGPLNEHLYKEWEKDGRRDEGDKNFEEQNNRRITIPQLQGRLPDCMRSIYYEVNKGEWKEVEDKKDKKDKFDDLVKCIKGNMDRWEIVDIDRSLSLCDIILNKLSDSEKIRKVKEARENLKKGLRSKISGFLGDSGKSVSSLIYVIDKRLDEVKDVFQNDQNKIEGLVNFIKDNQHELGIVDIDRLMTLCDSLTFSSEEKPDLKRTLRSKISKFLDNLSGNLEEIVDINLIPSLIDVIYKRWNDVKGEFQNNQERVRKLTAFMVILIERKVGLAEVEDVEHLIDLCNKLTKLTNDQKIKEILKKLKMHLSEVLKALIRDQIKELLRKEEVVKTLLRLFPLLLSQDVRNIIQGNRKTEWTVKYKLGERVLSRFTVEMGKSEIEIKGIERNNREQEEEQDSEDALFFYLTCPFISWVKNNQDYKALSNIMLNLVNRGTRRSVLTYERNFLKKLSFAENNIHYNGVKILNVEGL